ncbi:hypothetical protein IAE57_02520 [Stenotrophomonas sp. S48]|uniref:hypothetical protein n=1 Tax=unclassified Stenotrophomonas TaxID=196198 RepID=UPI0019014EA7|nr:MULTISPECIES: hypothetical protein [unclassified Stenotrophomonas]MBK0025023.1 hypothetical protein [Stenotrophomonas sp. S48]MBK0046727.1 hypothetical protein [Stenotrophomonas sp. S49]
MPFKRPFENPMSTEYSTPPSQAATVNPMRLPNTLHLTLGAFAMVMGLVLLLGVSNAEQVRAMGLGSVGRAMTGLTLLLLGGVHMGVAMRYFRFTVLPGEAGQIAVPSGTGSVSNHLVGLINDGITVRQRPDDPLLSMLYGLVPHLINAPSAIRWHAETQLRRAVYLAGVLVSFALAWVFAQPAAFAWMAGLYFALAVLLLKPFATLAAIRRGAMEAAPNTVPAPRWGAMVALLLVSIAGPLAITLSPVQVPTPPFAVATVVLPTIAVLGSALIASALFTVSLIAQTGGYSASAARHLVREDLQMPDLTSGLLERLKTRMPYPSQYYAQDHEVSNDAFDGHLLLETEPRVRADQSAPRLAEAFSAAWNSDTQRPLLALGLFGLVLGLVGVVFAFLYARSSGAAMMGLIALGFISSAQFALASAHKLWNRVDFQSTVYRVSYRGTYHRAKRVAGNAYAGNGTLAEGAVRFGPLRVAVCVAEVTSVAFTRGGKRHITALDLLPDESRALFGVFEDYSRDAQDRAGQFYQQEHQVREVMSQGARPPELPQRQQTVEQV